MQEQRQQSIFHDCINRHEINHDSISLGPNIYIDKSKQQLENMNAISEDFRKFKLKRLSDMIDRKQFMLRLSAMHFPDMSEQALKRWSIARDVYLGQPPFSCLDEQQQQWKLNEKIAQTEHATSVFTLDSSQFAKHIATTITDQCKDKCVGTDDMNQTKVKQNDRLVSVFAFSERCYSSDRTVMDSKQETTSNRNSLEYCDKATETTVASLVEMGTETQNGIVQKRAKSSRTDSNTGTITDADDTKTIVSSTKTNNSIYEQFRILRFRFKRLSYERRLLSCLLFLYLFIMLGLLAVIFILFRVFQGRPLIVYEDIVTTETAMIDGVAQYGESCTIDSDCKRPFTCFKKLSTGVCRCPLNYDLVNNQCVGDLNALCKKDTDCQRYMLCSGMYDGTRRCHCQTSYSYDSERKQCTGYHWASCETSFDCRANLICNKTTMLSLCLCPVNYRFNSLLHKCLGDPGAICEATAADCTDHAECRDGVCECAFQYVPDHNKLCVDPCPQLVSNPVKIRYPGNCRRFIDCQRRLKSECPETTIFNFRTQLCDYPRNVLDCL